MLAFVPSLDEMLFVQSADVCLQQTSLKRQASGDETKTRAYNIASQFIWLKRWQFSSRLVQKVAIHSAFEWAKKMGANSTFRGSQRAVLMAHSARFQFHEKKLLYLFSAWPFTDNLCYFDDVESGFYIKHVWDLLCDTVSTFAINRH